MQTFAALGWITSACLLVALKFVESPTAMQAGFPEYWTPKEISELGATGGLLVFSAMLIGVILKISRDSTKNVTAILKDNQAERTAAKETMDRVCEANEKTQGKLTGEVHRMVEHCSAATARRNHGSG